MEEVRYGVIGNVDSGKSTLIGVITNKELDDGRGKARSTILRHPHERLVSSYKHFKKWGDVVCDGTFDSFIAQCNATQPLQCRDDLNFWSDQIKHRTFARDSLLYQLGNVMR
jgi:ATPase subunit of ABC transporter with duplicated ATPase domains